MWTARHAPSRAIALAIVLLAAMAAIGHAGKFNRQLSPGDRAPSWTGLVGVDDRPHALADYKSKVLVLVFTCNHCPVAQAYEDRLLDLARAYAPRGVGWVAINCNTIEPDKLPAMKARAAEKRYPFDYLYDPSQSSGRAYGARVTPEVFVLDADRRLRYTGAIDDSWSDAAQVKTPYLRQALDALLDGKTPEVAETKPIGCGLLYDE
jgi:thiol-disulfide isomerase/thioredoxin